MQLLIIVFALFYAIIFFFCSTALHFIIFFCSLKLVFICTVLLLFIINITPIIFFLFVFFSLFR